MTTLSERILGLKRAKPFTDLEALHYSNSKEANDAAISWNAALEAAAAIIGEVYGQQWHPIESAPRDIPILGCNSQNRCMDIIQLDTPVDWRYASPPDLWMPLPGMLAEINLTPKESKAHEGK